MNHLDNLLKWYSTLTVDTVKDARLFYQPNAHFKDPFNDVHDINAIEAIFAHMFETTENPRFIIHEKIAQDRQAFVTWTFEFTLQKKPYSVIGGSHLKFDKDGLVVEHRDYWDAAEELFAKLPVIGWPIRWLRKQFLVKI